MKYAGGYSLPPSTNWRKQMPDLEKKVTRYEITKPNGKVIYRSEAEWDKDAKKRYESKGCKVKEVRE
jgi:hypothetical protein|tara:strand:- start:515 stop:715 length:201 start_codon:yes stop_codon:yes gene_type:complete